MKRKATGELSHYGERGGMSGLGHAKEEGRRLDTLTGRIIQVRMNYVSDLLNTARVSDRFIIYL
jgi:hypothetical protein